jgi:hypothetical protein
LLKNTSDFKVSVEVSGIEFDDALEKFERLLLVTLLTRLDLSKDTNRFIAIFKFVLLQNCSQVKFRTLKVSLVELNLRHTK